MLLGDMLGTVNNTPLAELEQRETTQTAACPHITARAYEPRGAGGPIS
jgi:hypothetical protein